ncbi:MAG: cell division FtsA domain-containing protein [Patescibacteria group bacterium]
MGSTRGEPEGLSVLPCPGWPERLASGPELAETARAAMDEACTMAGVRRNPLAWVALGGAGADYVIARGTARIGAADGRVLPGDYERAAAAALAGEDRRNLIHAFAVSSTLDGTHSLEEPHGLIGSRLETNVLCVAPKHGFLTGTIPALAHAGFRTAGFVLATISAACVLTPAEMEIGALLLDLGGTHSSLAVFARGRPRHLASVRFGGLQVTRDLAVALGVPLARAEEIKLRGLLDRAMYERVVLARWREIFIMLRAAFVQGWPGRLAGGCVLTGGAASTRDLPELARDILGMPVRVGVAACGRTQETLAGPAFAATLGLLSAGERRLIWGDILHAPKEAVPWRLRLPRHSSPA